MTQDDVSRLERGQLANLPLPKSDRIASALDAELVIFVRWRGGEIDRLMDEGHASVMGWVVRLLTELGWETRLEVSFSVGRERGSIDVLAWHAPSRTLLVVEVKTELMSVEETLRVHDMKQRLAARVAEERFGWLRPQAVCRLLVLPGLTTPRRQVSRHHAVLSPTYRLRGADLRAWLAAPAGPASGLIFAPRTQMARTRHGGTSRKRIRRTAFQRGQVGQ